MSSSRASSLSQPKSEPLEADWWKEAAQSFSPSKITSSSINNEPSYGSITPPSYVTSPNRYNSFDNYGGENTNNTNDVSLQDCTAAAAVNFNDDIFGVDDTNKLLQPSGALSDISNDSSDSESDGDYSSYASDDSDHSLERPHRTIGLIFFDSVRLIAFSANIRFFNTQMMPVLMAWKTMDILNKCLR